MYVSTVTLLLKVILRPYQTILSNISASEIIWQHTHSHGTATKTYSDVTSQYTVPHSSKNNQTITGLIFTNGEQQYTVKNFIYFNFLDTICIIHFTKQIIQFYVSHSCKHNLHATPTIQFDVSHSCKHNLHATPTIHFDVFHGCKHDGIPKCA